MRNIRCDEILNRMDFSRLSVNDFEEQVKRHCIEKMNEYELEPRKIDKIKSYPEKKYEIFTLIFSNNDKKIFVLDTNSINYDEDLEERELYYSRIIAKRICDNMKRIKEDAMVGIEEIENEYKDKISKIEDTIKELKELDENEYNMDRFAYDALIGTSLMDAIDEDMNDIKTENEDLKKELKNSELKISELLNKLNISLNEIEKNRENLQLNTISKFEKVINKIKKILD